MQLILAMDLQRGLVVHGKRGDRRSYRPLTWGLSDSADPLLYLATLRPRFLYIADLDRITGKGSHDREIGRCCGMVKGCYVDRGIRSPADCLSGEKIINIVGTETAGTDLSLYEGGILSLDIRDGRVIPGDRDPLAVVREAAGMRFDGCLILNIGSVGTGEGPLSRNILEGLRDGCKGTLLYGGGISGEEDLGRLLSAGFDGAIVATAVHQGRIPLEAVRRGSWS